MTGRVTGRMNGCVTACLSRRGAVRAVAVVLTAAGLSQVAMALFIPAKAVVAQILLHQAWQRTLAGETRVRPWAWADTWPVARLTLPDRKTDLIVLAGASGQALAFGPGHVAQTTAPGAPGLSVIGGHRDTHLRVLSDIAPGEPIEIERPDGVKRIYRVSRTSIADARLPWKIPDDADGLVLVTCYPFNAVIPGGPLRYLVHAEPDEIGKRAPDRGTEGKKTSTGIRAPSAPY